MADVIVIQPADNRSKIALELRPPHVMRRHHNTCGFLSPGGRHDHPIANLQCNVVRSKVVDAARVPETNANYALGRRAVVVANDLVAFAATTIANRLTGLKATLEAVTSARPGLIDRCRRSPGSV
jgi:hypothetical protein